MTRTSLTVRILIGLTLGLVIGIAIAAADPPWRPTVLALVQPIGHLWLQGLQMTIIPLVFSLLVTGVASLAGQAALGGLPARAIALFAVLLLAGSAIGAGVALLIMAVAPPPAAAGAALRAGATGPVPEIPALDNWIASFIPANPIQAAAETQMVGLVVFALIFGLAAARIAPERRQILTGFFEAVSDVMLMIVQWVLQLAPIGVFALAIGVGAGAGIAAAGALLSYIMTVVSAQVVLILATYMLVVAVGRIGLVHFLRGVAAPQVVALTTQSSLATLPAMLAACEPLGIRPAVRDTVLPMAVSLFRITSPCANIAVSLYVATLYGVPLPATTVFAGVAVAALVSLAAVGLPGQVSFFTTLGPICITLGAPLSVLPLLLAVETIPDIFRTIGNVTGDLAVTRILEARSRRTDE